MEFKIFLSVGFFVLILGSTNSGASSITEADQVNHLNLIKQLSSEQIRTISNIYPDFKVLKICSGDFSGHKQNELVLGIWTPVETEANGKSEIHRVGLIKSGDQWQAHIIDDEIEKDQEISRVSPMRWKYTFGKHGFKAEMKCGIEREFGEDSDLTYSLGDKPFFDLKSSGLENNKVVCFATDDVYNNWDCVVYSSKEHRFKLWFQQAHAD